MAAKDKRPRTSDREKATLLRWFRQHDSAGSGKVSKAVLVEVLRAAGMSSFQIEEVFGEGGWSGQGRVPYEQFVEWLCESDSLAPSSPGVEMAPVELSAAPADTRREVVLQTLVLLTAAASWFAGKGQLHIEHSPSMPAANLGFSITGSNLSTARAITEKVKELIATASIELAVLKPAHALRQLSKTGGPECAGLVSSLSDKCESVGLHVVEIAGARFCTPAVATVTVPAALRAVPWQIRGASAPGQFQLVGPTDDLSGLSSGEIGRFGLRRDMDPGVTECNKAAKASEQTGEALRAEAIHENSLGEMSAKIAAVAKERACVVIVCGPSSSGKTTFSCRLATHIQARGIDAKPFECDMYFKARADPTHPRDAKGELDFEDPNALRLDKIKQDLQTLFSGSRIKLPKFCFKTGTIDHDSGHFLQLNGKAVLIVEGIFGLHPVFLSAFTEISLFKVLIGPWSGARLGGLHIVPERKLRLLRRIGRDVRSRGVDAARVMHKFASVAAGENLNIFPYATSADVVFDSALHYELPALRGVIGKDVESAFSDDPIVQSRQRELANYLSWAEVWHTASYCQVPTSILCEFLGNSIFE